LEFNELEKLIKTRRSIRAWEDKPVPEKLLMQAVELATWAPNGANAQNWHFYIILNKDIIKAVAGACGAGMAAMMSWPEMAQLRPPTPPPGTNRPAPRPNAMAGAPAMIAVSTRKAPSPFEKVWEAREKVDPKAGEMRQANAAVDSAIQSVSAAISYLLLILHQMGLGAVWMTGPLPGGKSEVEKILKVPSANDLIALLPVGYPAETPTNTRKPVADVCTVLK
jgi:nitroreductase